MTQTPISPAAQLGIGTATFVPRYGIGREQELASDALIHSAAAAGVRYVDTAAAYGDSEAALGGMRAQLDALKIRICTKVGARDQTEPGRLRAEAQASFDRLGAAAIDTMMLHSASVSALRSPQVGELFTEVRRRGWAERTGASTYGAEAAVAALERPWCEAVQIEFSILNQQVWRRIKSVRQSHQEVVVRSVLCKGLLTDRAEAASDLVRPIASDLLALSALASAWGFTLPEMAIRFALDTAGIDVVLVGIASEEELRTALRATEHPALTPDQLARLDEFDRSHLDCVHPQRWNATTASGAAS